MRLTLRTLLAYLDDTLEPAQARQIGQKVAESDTAQELIARIKQVTRRRRLTTPPESGPNKIDPNTIAEYLDNTLNSDQLADVEQVCLASDVHLAEMASCHQILTLVLGEPALVPPTAKQRMYALVKGREAIPFRKPPAREGRDADELPAEGREVDETLRLGLPALRRKEGWRNPLILLAGAVGLVACLVIAITQLLPSAPQGEPKGRSKASELEASLNNKKKGGGKDVEIIAPADDRDSKKKKADNSTKDGTLKDDGKKDQALKHDGKKDLASKDGEKKDEGKKDLAAKNDGKKDGGTAKDKSNGVVKPGEVPPGPPSTRVVEIGRFEYPQAPETTVLLQYDPTKSKWKRLMRQTRPTLISTGHPLVSLPGFPSVIQTDKGVRLILAGTMPEFFAGAPLFESLVELHAHDVLDLDLTLKRGRIFLTNTNATRPAHVRVRFDNTTQPASREMWDITLEEKDATVMIDCFGYFMPGQPFTDDPKSPMREGPVTQMGLTVTKGTVNFRADNFAYALHAPPGPARMVWNSVQGWPRQDGSEGPIKLTKLEDWARLDPAIPREMPREMAKEMETQRSNMRLAANELSKDLVSPLVEAGLSKSLKSPQGPADAQRRLTVRCFGALDMSGQLVDALHNKNGTVRRAAIETLMHWLAADRDNDYKLFAELKARFAPVESTNIISLLHGPIIRRGLPPETVERLADPLIDALANRRLPIRELAAWQLYAAFPQALQEIRFDAAQPPEALRGVQAQWRKYVQKHKMPGGQGPR